MYFISRTRIPLTPVLIALLLFPMLANAQRVSLQQTYSCSFPWVGEEPYTIVIANNEFPERVPSEPPVRDLGVRIHPGPDNLVSWLEFFGGETYEGTAELRGELIYENWRRDIVVPLEFENSTFFQSASGEGRFPDWVFSDVGEGRGEVRFSEFSLDVRIRKSNGTLMSGSLGAYQPDCTLQAGADTLLHVFETVEYGLSEDQLDFGSIQLNETESRQFYFDNYLERPLVVDQMLISGPGADDYYIEDNRCSTVNGGRDCIVTVGFQPSSTGSRDALLEVVLTEPGVPPLELPLRGSGIARFQAGEITLDAGNGSFGDVPTGIYHENPVRIINTGDDDINLTMSVEGPGSDVFAVWTYTCDDPLDPGEACLLFPGYEPDTAMAHAATLVVTADDPTVEPLTIPLSGRGTNEATYISELGLGGYESTISPEQARGVIVAEVNVDDTRFVAEADLDPLRPLLPYWGNIMMQPYIEHVFTGPFEGTVSSSGELQASAMAYFRVSRIWFGVPLVFDLSDITLSNCQTTQPVKVTLRSVEGGNFNWQRGGNVQIEFTRPDFSNCSFYTGTLNDNLAGQPLSKEMMLRRLLP